VIIADDGAGFNIRGFFFPTQPTLQKLYFYQSPLWGWGDKEGAIKTAQKKWGEQLRHGWRLGFVFSVMLSGG
jgi:hypothetical protein